MAPETDELENARIGRREVLKGAGSLGIGALGVGTMVGSAEARKECLTFNVPGVERIKVRACATEQGATLNWMLFGMTVMRHDVEPEDGYMHANATLPVPGTSIPADVVKIDEWYGMPDSDTVRLDIGVAFCNFRGWPPGLECTPEADISHTFNF